MIRLFLIGIVILYYSPFACANSRDVAPKQESALRQEKIASQQEGVIHPGMTREEVREILGSPYIDYFVQGGEAWYYKAPQEQTIYFTDYFKGVVGEVRYERFNQEDVLEDIRNILKIEYNLEEPEPTEEQLENIFKEIRDYEKQGYTDSQISEKIKDIVKKHCSSYKLKKWCIFWRGGDESELIDSMMRLLSALEQ